MRVRLEQVPLSEVPWDDLDGRPDRSVFCTAAWLRFLATSQQVRPVVARVLLDGAPVGWFSAAVRSRAGLRLLGSPLPGWSTSYMGFDWDDPGDARLLPVALAAARRWAFVDLRCVHIEVLSRVDPATLELPPGATCGVFHSYARTLADDDTMFAAMSTNARRNIRRAERRLLAVEEVGSRDTAGFAGECYAQVRDAFLRRGVSPTYGGDRIRDLLDAMLPSGNLLALRALTEDGRTAGTCISAGMAGGRAVFLTGAADPFLLDVRPNEALMWHTMRAWRDRGAHTFDFGGGGTYKLKFGCTPVESAWVRSSLLPGAEPARAAAKWLHRRAHYLGERAASQRVAMADQAAGAAPTETG